jgi:UDP-N-acetylmuramate-alanine ligase
MYDQAFKNADIVVIPRLTRLKVSSDQGSNIEENLNVLPMEGQELATTIQKTHKNVHFIDDDKKLVYFLKTESKQGDVIVFLGSHGFRGMIEETTTSLHPQSLS